MNMFGGQYLGVLVGGYDHQVLTVWSVYEEPMWGGLELVQGPRYLTFWE